MEIADSRLTALDVQCLVLLNLIMGAPIMDDIGPERTHEELQSSAQRTREGKGRPQLPGVKADAVTMGPEEYKKNRELARRINDAVSAVKGGDENGPHFVLGWRLYPNKDHPRWKEKQSHSCGCGCACASHHHHHPPPGK
jgi:hypothetical protein